MMRQKLISVFAALAMAMGVGALSLVTASPAQAADCTQIYHQAKTDPDHNSWTTSWSCGNARGVALYREPNTGSITGYQSGSTSLFVCWKRGSLHAGGNNVWYYTQGDQIASGAGSRYAWGYMPARNVYTSTDPWPGMARCPYPSTPSTPARSDGTNKPVLFLHGFEVLGSLNCNTYWGSGQAISLFQNMGWSSGNIVALTYYGSGGGACTRFASANTGTSIEEIGFDLAWYIYNNYSSKGKAVDIVTHSMGGLVTRVAIAGTSNRRTVSGMSFPPFLFIEDVATLSTPHEGATAVTRAECTAVGFPYQCTEMMPGSSFLNSWIIRPLPASNRVGYDNPQSQMGTDWSLVGSDDDDTVNAASAVSLTASYPFGHKYIYTNGGLEHGDMSDIGKQNGMGYHVRFCDYTASCSMKDRSTWDRDDSYYGPLWVAANAVQMRAAW
jgi:hypothetical protein